MADPKRDDDGRERSDRGDRHAKAVQELRAEAERRVGDRRAIEKRWLDDTRQYQGRYEDKVERILQQADDGRSRAFMNSTRIKTRTLAAKLKEMLFPSDEANWEIGPTPVPELVADASSAVEDARKARAEADRMAEQAAAEEGGVPPEAMQQAEAAAQQAESVAERLSAVMQEARRRCDRMSAEIEDQLGEGDFERHCRRVIDTGCLLGTGILKGPLAAQPRARWKAREQTGENGAVVPAYELDRRRRAKKGGKSEDDKAEPAFLKPRFKWTDPWNWFPDPSASCVEESEGFFERHILSKKGVRKLADDPTFDREAIARLVKDGPDSDAPSYLNELRDLTEDQQQPVRDRWIVWEYRGPMEPEDAEAIAKRLGDEEMAAIAREAADDVLTAFDVVLWFCRDEVLRLEPDPLETGEPPYSVWVMEPQEGSIWGKGIPAIMRDPQSALNSAWRAMLDNAGMGAGPHIFFDPAKVEPYDGTYGMKTPKLWKLKKSLMQGEVAFDQFQITMNQDQLAGIINLASQFIDIETGLPQMQSGEQTEHTTKTLGGIALLMSAGQSVFREMVKRWDDDITVPTLKRGYDWNMQFNPKEHIKGDYEVKARGVSVLLVREIQSQNLLMAYQLFGPEDPDIRADEMKRAILRSMMLNTDVFVRTPEERERFVSELASGPSEADVKMEELAIKREEHDMRTAVAELEAHSRETVAELGYDAEMMRAAQHYNLTLEQLEARLAEKRIAADSDERRQAVEVAMRERTGESAGGSV